MSSFPISGSAPHNPKLDEPSAGRKFSASKQQLLTPNADAVPPPPQNLPILQAKKSSLQGSAIFIKKSSEDGNKTSSTMSQFGAAIVRALHSIPRIAKDIALSLTKFRGLLRVQKELHRQRAYLKELEKSSSIIEILRVQKNISLLKKESSKIASDIFSCAQIPRGLLDLALVTVQLIALVGPTTQMGAAGLARLGTTLGFVASTLNIPFGITEGAINTHRVGHYAQKYNKTNQVLEGLEKQRQNIQNNAVKKLYEYKIEDIKTERSKIRSKIACQLICLGAAILTVASGILVVIGTCIPVTAPFVLIGVALGLGISSFAMKSASTAYQGIRYRLPQTITEKEIRQYVQDECAEIDKAIDSGEFDWHLQQITRLTALPNLAATTEEKSVSSTLLKEIGKETKKYYVFLNLIEKREPSDDAAQT